jgi:cleavage and polyadenylation specificity factor subunit 2
LNILYASDVLQRGERFLDGLALKALGKNPALLIQDVLGISQPASLPVKQRDQAAAGHILAALRAGGDVLVPTDSTGRVLELLLLLDETWAQEGLVQAYDLVFLTRVSSVLDGACAARLPR